MVFGNEAAGFAEFGMGAATGPLGALSEVAEASRGAGEASVTGQNPGFAYTRAGVSLAMGFMVLKPAVGELARGLPSLSPSASVLPKLSPVLTTQKELSLLVHRQAAVVDRWLGRSDSRWAELYRSVQNSNPNFAAGIRGRILDIRTRSLFRDLYTGRVAGVRIDETIPGSGNALRPDLYFPNLDGRRVIFDVGGPSKVGEIEKYSGMADELIPLIPEQWIIP